MGKKKELVVSVIFNGHDGERYKIPTYKHDIEKITLLDCGDIDCLGHKIECRDCIFRGENTFRKGELELIVEEREEEEEYRLEDLEDLEEIKDFNEDTERFVLFKDKKGREHLIPFVGNFMMIDEEITIGCRNINCYGCGDLHCIECPFIGHGKLNPGEFKILKPKDKGSEEWRIEDVKEQIRRHKKRIRKVYKNLI